MLKNCDVNDAFIHTYHFPQQKIIAFLASKNPRGIAAVVFWHK